MMDKVANIAGAICPLASGGVQTAISGQPANFARTAVMTTVETKGTLPPGMYKPTRSIG